MSQEMECMCQECGISTYLPLNMISLEDPSNTDMKLLSDLSVCQECGGRLVLIGKAGEEAHYRLK